jgi:2-keto-4-pentenoate hydratase/2-oxohepta-3-ene-1,7-dioic acid hydratase in catechol pathway
VASPGKVVCIGLNYRDHATETGVAMPKEPIIFRKGPNTVIVPNDTVLIPRKLIKTDCANPAAGSIPVPTWPWTVG